MTVLERDSILSFVDPSVRRCDGLFVVCCSVNVFIARIVAYGYGYGASGEQLMSLHATLFLKYRALLLQRFSRLTK